MKTTLLLMLGMLALATAGRAAETPASVASQSERLSAAVDALFQEWNHPDTPGAVCAVIQNGKMLHAKGYGMEDLAHHEPLSPDSVFYIASTSKQFTAASIALLVLDGQLSLDADIRQYLPEISGLGKAVTVRNLVYHTSGLRDYFDLLGLTGWRDTDYFNNEMVVKLLARHRGLNFEPGAEHLYSNSNYVLLAEIVQRASHRSLRRFADEQIFRPLGMDHTHFDDDYRKVVPHRVISYAPKKDGGYQDQPKEFDGYGDGNLLTTVGDLARWDENFYTARLGGKAFVELIQQRGVLTSGKKIDYAFGLMPGTYRGLPTVSHGGAFKGFRTEFLRFPRQKLSVIVLGNLATINATDLAQRVADLYLASEFTVPLKGSPVAGAKRSAVNIKPALFDAYVGGYAMDNRPSYVLTFSREGDRFYSQPTGQGRVEIFPSSDTIFFLEAADAQITFYRDADGKVSRVTLHQGGDHRGGDLVAHRLKSPYATVEALAEFCGSYRSEELDTSFRIEVEQGQLVARNDRTDAVTLAAADRDTFSTPVGRDVFVRDRDKHITGITVSTGRSRNMLFERQAASRTP